jgi:hypothetical protein
MSASPFEINLATVFLAGLMVAALAVTALIVRGGRPLTRALVMAAVALSVGAGVAALLPETMQLGTAALLVAGFGVAAWLVRSSPLATLGTRGARMLRRPESQWGLTLAAAVLVCCFSVVGLEADVQAFEDEEFPQGTARLKVQDLEGPPRAFTDRGTAVVVRHPLDRDVEAVVREEAQFLQQHGYTLKVIRAGGVDLDANCHGWVFTGGRFWVGGTTVDLILKENGYREVPEPRANDVAVWRDADGKVIHTGVVYGTGRDGRLLLESKWAGFGRFIHSAEDHPYRGKLTFHRSPRPGNILKGIEPASFPPTSPAAG